MRYRLAEMIEFHDAKHYITVHNYNDELVGWDIVPGYAEITFIKGDALATILNSLNPSNGFSTSFTYQYFPILKKQYLTTDTDKWHIHRLLVAPINDKQLRIKIIFSFETTGSPETMTTCFHVADLSYSGAYTVWWVTDPAKASIKRHGKLTLEQINRIIERLTMANMADGECKEDPE